MISHRLLGLLRGKADFYSGEKISAELGISRAAVWKHIEHLRRTGFVIAAFPARGYKLISAPDLSPEDIRASILNDFWREVLFYQTADSTNERAASLIIGKKFLPGTVILADRQEKGRGRLGRSWASPPARNVYLSILFQPDLQPRDATLLTILSAVACARAIRSKTGTQVSIKWPNDLTSSGKKIGGILTEVRSDPDKIQAAIIGIGINVNSEKEDFSPELRETATSIRIESGNLYSRSRLIIELLKEFETWYTTLREGGRTVLLQEWRRLSSTIGKTVMVLTSAERLEGFAEDIDEDGRLILKLSSGKQLRISSGDITMLR